MSKELNFYEALEVMRGNKIVITDDKIMLKLKDNVIYAKGLKDFLWSQTSITFNTLLMTTFTEEPKPVKMVKYYAYPLPETKGATSFRLCFANDEHRLLEVNNHWKTRDMSIKLDEKGLYVEVSSEDN